MADAGRPADREEKGPAHSLHGVVLLKMRTQRLTNATNKKAEWQFIYNILNRPRVHISHAIHAITSESYIGLPSIVHLILDSFSFE